MLDLDSDKRVTAEIALAHDYLSQYADPSDEPTSEVFDDTFDNLDLEIPEWRGIIFMNHSDSCCKLDLIKIVTPVNNNYVIITPMIL